MKPDPPRQVASSSRTDEEIIDQINALVRRRWNEEGIKPAALATDAEWCRRVYLDIVGRIPTYDETARFLAERGPQKRTRLIERLLDSDDGVQEYARNWTNIWSALLIGRSDAGGGMANRDGMQQYLRRSLLSNKPYDQMVAELISADGANTPGADDFNGAVNFVLDNLQENAISATAKTARLFLGMQVQCTQCHNHPFNDWKQDQFWELNSFYRQAKAQPQRSDGQAVDAAGRRRLPRRGGQQPRRSRSLLGDAQRPDQSLLPRFHRWHAHRPQRRGGESQPPRRIGPPRGPLAADAAGLGQSPLGPLPRLWHDAACGRHGSAQSSFASGAVGRAGQRVSARLRRETRHSLAHA